MIRRRTICCLDIQTSLKQKEVGLWTGLEAILRFCNNNLTEKI